VGSKKRPAAAAAEGAGEEDAEVDETDRQDDEKLPLRRDGFPARTFAERNGDLFKTLSMPKADVHLDKLAEIRAAKLRSRGWDEVDGYLKLDAAQEVVKEYRTSVWSREPEQTAKEEELRRRCSSKEDVQRTVASNFRTAMYERFGGLPWMTWYVATGDVDDVLVDLVNEHISQQVRDKGHREPSTSGPHPAPKLSARNAATSAGQVAPPHRGVQHTVTEAKEARKKAKALEKYVEKLENDRRSTARSVQRKRDEMEATIENKSSHIVLAITWP
jgi:hypothetical protein